MIGIPGLSTLADNVARALKDTWAQMEEIFLVEHTEDGAHTDITATSATVTGAITGESVSVADDTAMLGELPAAAPAVGGLGLLLSPWRWIAYDDNAEGQLLVQNLNVSTAYLWRWLRGLSATQWYFEPEPTVSLYLGRQTTHPLAEVNTLTASSTNGYTERGRSTPNGAWDPYTPSWTGTTTNGTIGNGTLTGRYTRVGKTVFFKVYLSIGTTTTIATGRWAFSLPVTKRTESDNIGGSALGTDTGVAFYPLDLLLASTTTTELVSPTGVSVTDIAPFAWGSTDTLMLTGSYEEA